MIYIIGFALAFVIFCFPKIRCVILNPIKTICNLPVDIYWYFKHKKYNQCPCGVIVAIMGLFGRGKTLTSVHMVARMYKRKDGKMVYCPRRDCMVKQRIRILSNVNLKLPYEQLVSLEQIINAPEQNTVYDDLQNTLTVTLVLIDEASVQLNSRNFKSNIDALLLNSILTCRHNYIAIYYTAQRYMQVDALLRQVTSYCIDCQKTWRLQGVNYYDAWEMENATSPTVVKPYRRSCWFVTNKDYNLYDTFATVDNLKNSYKLGQMMTEDEILSLQRNQPDNDNVMAPSKKFRRIKKRMYK